jgi:hypothetical protein
MADLQPEVVIEGEAKGADTLARQAAEYFGIPVLAYPANWDRYGAAAGPIRNRQMLMEGCPDAVVAFHNDIQTSKGTKNMIAQALKQGLLVMVYTEKGCQTIYRAARKSS